MTKAQFVDLFERAAWTFVQAFVGVLVATSMFTGDTPANLDAWKAAAVAAVIAGVKAVVAQQFGNGTAATVPVDVEATLPDGPVE